MYNHSELALCCILGYRVRKNIILSRIILIKKYFRTALAFLEVIEGVRTYDLMIDGSALLRYLLQASLSLLDLVMAYNGLKPVASNFKRFFVDVFLGIKDKTGKRMLGSVRLSHDECACVFACVCEGAGNCKLK